jgi:hypothetical protein
MPLPGQGCGASTDTSRAEDLSSVLSTLKRAAMSLSPDKQPSVALLQQLNAELHAAAQTLAVRNIQLPDLACHAKDFLPVGVLLHVEVARVRRHVKVHFNALRTWHMAPSARTPSRLAHKLFRPGLVPGPHLVPSRAGLSPPAPKPQMMIKANSYHAYAAQAARAVSLLTDHGHPPVLVCPRCPRCAPSFTERWARSQAS